MSYEKEELPPVHLRFGKDALKHTIKHLEDEWPFRLAACGEIVPGLQLGEGLLRAVIARRDG